MLDRLLAIVAPHHCCGCDKIGCLLCDNCKYDITQEQTILCIVCQRPTHQNWLCKECKMPYEKAWMVGERSGVLQRLIGLYKFERAKAAYLPLADLLVASLPELPSNVIIVPIPTVWSHIRARGYDHMLLIAKRVAKLTNRPCSQVLTRKISSKQRQASAKQRARQAKQAFAIEGQIQPDKIYLIIDDVMTTGATIKYAAKTLRQAGAKHVWVAVIARQPKLGRSN